MQEGIKFVFKLLNIDKIVKEIENIVISKVKRDGQLIKNEKISTII